MVQSAQKDVINMIRILFLVIFTTGISFAQDTTRRNLPAAIGLFPKPGFEPNPPHKSAVVDKSHLKPGNFRFSGKGGINLQSFLLTGIGPVTADCRPYWGLFAFRVNGTGKIDSTWSAGQMPIENTKRILTNIRATEGSWIIQSGTKTEDVAWYVFFYSDTRGRWQPNLNCSESEKDLQKAISSMSGFFYNMFHQLSDNLATVISPVEFTGLPAN